MAIRGISERVDFGLFPANGGASTPISIQPFTEVPLDDSEELLKWINCTTDELCDYYAPFRRLYKDNISMYVGGEINTSTWWSGETFFKAGGSAKANVIRPVVESHLARITSTRAHVSVLPVHSGEFEDLAAAKNATKVLEMSFSERSVDKKFEHVARCGLICGSAYLLVDWDNTIGPRLPEIEEGVPVLDENGEPKVDEDGRPILIHGDIRAGDVNYKFLRPDQVLEQPTSPDQECDWIFVLEMRDVYKVREQFPTMSEEIRATDTLFGTDSDLLLRKTTEKQVLVIQMFHKATPTFPNGRYIICTPEVILENTELPYPTLNQYGLIPVVRFHDMEVPGYVQPLPLTVMEAGKPYQNLHNKLTSNIHRNLSLQTPKWLVQSQSGVKPEHLNNTSNIVNYRTQRPELVSPSTTSPEIYNYRNQILQEMQVATGASHMLSAPPPNTRAASMLEHYEEQEFRRAEPLIRHMNDFQADVAKIALAIMADKYSDLDERVVKLMGDKTAGGFIRLKTQDLTGPFDIKFERTSALPESKQGRLNEAARMLQLGIMSIDQYKTVVGYNADPELADADSKAFEKQLLETDKVVRRMQVNPPSEFEDHVQHLKALYPVIQSTEFSMYPEEVQEALKAHAMAHEMFAWQRAQVSMTYAVKVAEHVQFLFFAELPKAAPVSMGMPATPLDDTIQTRLTTPGLMTPSDNLIEPANPGNPEAV